VIADDYVDTIVKKKDRKAFGFPHELPPGFNSGAFMAGPVETTPIGLDIIRLIASPIPLVPETDSESSYESSRELKKPFKLDYQALHPFTKMEYE
jgi:hypothetical protein